MIKNQLFIAAALFVGVAVGYIMKPDRAAEVDDDKGYVAVSKIADKGEAASMKALRTRIAELEKLLAAQEAKVKGEGEQMTEAKPVAEAQGERRGPPSMKDMRERMEKMAKEDPQRFAQITNRMARWRQRRAERASAKLDFLESVDTSGMTDEQKNTHESYQDLLVRREELEEKMHNPDMTDDDRADIMREMRETDHAIREQAKQERETLIAQTAKILGFTGDEATAVSATIQDVVNSTESGHGFPPPPPDGGPGGPK